ncbi:MAG: serine hydrolase [Leptolyngbya sp. SIO4C1]|nr:serine hydrolase [Leptolyngbya sp. SIO4C1]
MPSLWYATKTVFSTLALTVGIAWLRPPIALAPEWVSAHPTLAQIDRANSVDDLHQLRSQIQTEIKSLPQLTYARDMGVIAPYLTLSQLTFRLSQSIAFEEDAKATYGRAIELADQAVALHQSGDRTLASLQQQEFLWGAAIRKLAAVEADSVLAAQAASKVEQYQQILRPIERQVDAQQSGFLEAIAGQLGPAEDVRIVVCQLDSRECRSFQGDVPPASPASLIKLPIAIALMQRVTEAGIDLDEKIYIDPGNFTENADGAKIFVDREYALREVMARMIKESNNIATNQLIDYLGRDYINQTFRELGFPVTFVDYKLVGDSTFPKNAGSKSNRSTARELTEMMRRIYSFEIAGDAELLDALVGQYDWDFGYQALQNAGPAVHWIGEKTGQNSKVIGSTLAVKIGEERYVMTVTIDHSANQIRLRQIIRDVADHILENGPLDDSRQR